VNADPPGHEIAFGRFVVQHAQRRLLVDGRVAKLSTQAFDILVTLIAGRGRMVSKSELLEVVWPRRVVEESNIHVHVSALRKVLGPDVISTVPGRGYRFIHPLGTEQTSGERGAVGGGAVSAQGDGEGVFESTARAATAGNLALSLPALYGRTEDLATVLALLQAHRLVTLVGTGGIGKTRLALAAARADRERWPGGVWFVELASVREDGEVPRAVAQVLGLGLSAHRDAAEELALALRSRAALLLLDNAEHVQEATAALATTLLSRSTHLAFLVTSRQGLHVPQEQCFHVPPLSVPGDVVATDPQRFGAMALFEARAAAASSAFRIDARNTAAIADICRHVDGVPLAIELAAARVHVLGVDGLRGRLLESLRALGSGNPRSLPRHRTLRATFDWTHDMLLPVERTLLRRLAVFVGGFTLELAQHVAVDVEGDGRALDSWGVLDALSALIDKSLVHANEADPPRYRMLEVTRAYALEKLVEAGEADRLSARHARAVWWIFTQAETAKNEKTSGAISMSQYLARLSPELDNLRAARVWSNGPSADRSIAIGLAASSSEALRMLGLSTEAIRVMLTLAPAVDDSASPESAEMFWTGLCALGTHGRLPEADMLQVIEKAERMYRRMGSPRRVHLGLYRKGFALMHLGRCAEARQAVKEMESLEAADWPAKACALRLNLQGGVDGMLGRFEEAIDAFTRAARLLRYEPGEDDFVLNALANLCLPLLCIERHEEALAVARDVLGRGPTPAVRNSAQRAAFIALTFLGRLDEASSVARQAMPDWRSDDLLPHMLSAFAWLAHQQGRTADAVKLDWAAHLQGLRAGLSDTPVFDRARALLSRALNDRPHTESELTRWRTEGSQLREDELVALCLGNPSARADVWHG
jgi:predicted ATPase/DNA-binding winged helix-turn-helix (wHTH) protein